MYTEKGVSAFGVCLRRFSEEEISGIEEKSLSPFFFYLSDNCRFLGDTAKGTPESTAGFDLSHYVIGVDDAELDFGCGLDV